MNVDLEKFRKEHGKWLAEWMCFLAPLKQILADLKPEDSDTCWAAASLHLITFLDTEDPGPVHFRVCRDYLDTQGVKEDGAVDLLTRSLVDMIRKFRSFVLSQNKIDCDEESKQCSNNEASLEGLLMPSHSCLSNCIYEKESTNLLDYLLAEFLRPYGSMGADTSARVLDNSLQRHGEYRLAAYSYEMRPRSWALWISKNSSGVYSLFGTFLQLMTEVVWHDLCVSRWKKKSQNVPALTQGVHPTVVHLLSHSLNVSEGNLLCDKKIVGNFIPTMDQSLTHSIIKGIDRLNGIYHHKLLRFECRSGFENWVTGKQEFRFLEFSRGCAEIAELIGLTSNQAIEAIKNILNAQAYVEIRFQDGTRGNLISLTKFKSPSSGREEGVRILLGEKILPLNAFNSSRASRLLVPVPELPPFVGSSNSHGAQASLQMLVMQKFSDCSLEFLKFGCICISKKMWQDFAKEVGLAPSILNQVLDRWVQDGNDGPSFLTEVSSDHYSLSNSYHKEAVFLKNQGELRKQQKQRAEKSLQVRKGKEKR